MKGNLLLNQEISENSKLIEDIAFNISKEFTQELDKVMGICKSIFQSKDKITNQEIEDLLAQLPSILYFVNEGQEAVGIKQDIAEITRKTNYNIAREKANGTIADKNTTAEGQVINEAINEIIYQRAYKLIRAKIEMAQEMVNSLKRIFDARMMEYQIGNGVRR